MTKPDHVAETLAKQLHAWYLEATKELNPESYNPNAQKAYEDMTDEQKFIDRYIAKKVRQTIKYETDRNREQFIDFLKRHIKQARISGEIVYMHEMEEALKTRELRNPNGISDYEIGRHDESIVIYAFIKGQEV